MISCRVAFEFALSTVILTHHRTQHIVAGLPRRQAQDGPDTATSDPQLALIVPFLRALLGCVIVRLHLVLLLNPASVRSLGGVSFWSKRDICVVNLNRRRLRRWCWRRRLCLRRRNRIDVVASLAVHIPHAEL